MSFSHYVTEGGLALRIDHARRIPSLHLVGRPRRLHGISTGVSLIGEFGISYSPEGVALTARDGVAALFAEAPAAPQGVTRQFRLRLNGVARTFTSTFEGNDGNGRHGSLEFLRTRRRRRRRVERRRAPRLAAGPARVAIPPREPRRRPRHVHLRPLISTRRRRRRRDQVADAPLATSRCWSSRRAGRKGRAVASASSCA